MTDSKWANTPMTHWLVAGAALIWNLFGFSIYYMTVSITDEQMLSRFSREQIVYMEAIPIWVTSAFAIAVTAAVIASALLLLRKALALPVFLVSLVAILIQHTYSFVLTDVVAVLGILQAYIAATVFGITVLLILYSWWGRKKGLLT